MSWEGGRGRERFLQTGNHGGCLPCDWFARCSSFVFLFQFLTCFPTHGHMPGQGKDRSSFANCIIYLVIIYIDSSLSLGRFSSELSRISKYSQYSDAHTYDCLCSVLLEQVSPNIYTRCGEVFEYNVCWVFLQQLSTSLRIHGFSFAYMTMRDKLLVWIYFYL